MPQPKNPYRLKEEKRRFRSPPTCRYETGPFCDAPVKTPRGRLKIKRCRNFAGFKTSHPGQGKCFKHGGNGQKPYRRNKNGEVPIGRYSGTIEHHQLRDLTARVKDQEHDVLDLEDECHLLRALTIKFINEYEEFVEALMAWYADPKVKQKPRRIMDISDASRLIESISKVAERLHHIRETGAIDLQTFQRVTSQMGVIVALHVRDPEALQRIEAQWGDLALDAKRRQLTWRPDDDPDYPRQLEEHKRKQREEEEAAHDEASDEA